MKRFRNLLLIVDVDKDSQQAVARAITLAKNNQAALTICSVLETGWSPGQAASSPITPEELLDLETTRIREKLEAVVAVAAESGVDAAAEIIEGKPFLEIIRRVLIHGHDLVIKPTESPSDLKSMIFGSTDMHLLRKCPCPVWLIKPAEKPPYRRILAAVDRDPEEPLKDQLNRQILEMSASLALAEFSELHVVHAWKLFAEGFYRSGRVTVSEHEVEAMVSQEEEERQRWLRELVDSYGVAADRDAVDYLKPQLHVTKGDPKQVVPATAEALDADLIIMGTLARGGIAGLFMGNTAESILTQIDCSVLTLKPPGFVSPVTIEE